MKFLQRFLVGQLILLAAFFSVAGQNASPSPAQTGGDVTAYRVIGEVTSVEPEKGRLTLRTSVGEIAVLLDEDTKYLLVPPGAEGLNQAGPINLAEIKVGDRLIARGVVADDRKSVPAQQVIVMSRTAILQKQQQEREQWSKRGLVGMVNALNPATQEVTLMVRKDAALKQVIVKTAGAKVSYRRYLPDTVKLSDAVTSSFAEIKVGDQLRALGQYGADGASFIPEEIVTGAFRVLLGKIIAVNPATNELQIMLLQSAQPLTVVLKTETFVRRLTPELVELIKQKESAPAAATPAQPAAGKESASIQDLVEHLPLLKTGDLQPGEMTRILTSSGGTAQRITAINLTVGIEGLITIQQESKRATGLSQGLSGGALDGVGLP
jgi:hypothetical protein